MSKTGFAVPNWFMTVLKWSAPALIVGVGMYIQIALLQKDVQGFQSTVVAIQTASDARADATVSLTQRVANLEIKQAVEGKTISDSLARIESTVKEMQTDIKDINRRVPEKR